MKNLEHLRRAYQRGKLREEDMASDPMDMFTIWWQHTIDEQVEEANAMTLATSGKDGQPSARIVLLKGTTPEGFEFFTNYKSRKALDMADNNKVALLFFWQKLERQVRIEGYVEKVSPERSAAYFQSRPVGSQMGAWSSPQSTVIADRSVIENNLQAIQAKYANINPLPAPEHWGGFIVKPTAYEFWQGRDDRLHDRFRYLPLAEGGWKINRLAP